MTPSQRLDDGFSTIVTLENIPTVKMYEKEVTPPGFTGGGPIETTTMRNTAWRTAAPRQLKTLSPVTMNVAYATESLPIIREQIGVNQLITVTFPDASLMSFYGWIESFTPGANKEGDQPTAAVNVHPSNRNPAGDEVAPFYEEAVGESAE